MSAIVFGMLDYQQLLRKLIKCIRLHSECTHLHQAPVWRWVCNAVMVEGLAKMHWVTS